MPQVSSQLVTLLPLVAMFALMYFFLIRPQKKREKEMQEMRSALRVGDEVLTIGGVKGKIIKAGEDYLTIESSGRTRIEFTRSAIYRVLSAEELVDETVETEESDDQE
ncbi:MAG: preprotein translocase subunit YajC [Tissierellia bacterium]|nr:preprotein translocase subunit YajC [Tissierellia bacterium]